MTTFKVNRRTLRRIVLGKQKYIAGIRIRLFYLPLDTKATKELCRALGIRYGQFKQHMRELQSSGRINIPKEVKNSLKMIYKVATRIGAIGYVDNSKMVVYLGKTWGKALKNKKIKIIKIPSKK